MAHWLLKSEPDDWPWAEQVAKGRDGAEWTGIRNVSAQNHLRAMRTGEQAFFYHTGKARTIVDIVRVIAEAGSFSLSTGAGMARSCCRARGGCCRYWCRPTSGRACSKGHPVVDVIHPSTGRPEGRTT